MTFTYYSLKGKIYFYQINSDPNQWKLEDLFNIVDYSIESNIK